MDVSVVILTWNSAGYIRRCLDALRADLSGLREREIFVVDNGSSDRTPSLLREIEQEEPSLIKPIFFTENRGTTFPRNVALRRARGECIVVLDSDVEVARGTLARLRETLMSDERIGLAAPGLVHSDGSHQKSVDDFPTLIGKARRYFFLKRMEAEEGKAESFSGVRDVDYAISACWMLRRSAVEKVGLFDEAIFYSPEDVDYCVRLHAAGYRVVYVPTARAVHHAQELSRGFAVNLATVRHIRGLWYYFRKYNAFFGRPHV